MRAEVDDQKLLLEPRLSPHALQTPRDDALRIDEDGDDVAEHVDESAHARHRSVEVKRESVADGATEDTEEHSEKERVMQALREEKRRRRGRNEERNDEDRADGVECSDRRQGNQRHERVEDRARRHADETRVLLVKGRELEFLVKERDERRIDEEDRAHLDGGGCDLVPEKRHRIESRIDDLAHQHHVSVEVHVARILADEDDGKREEHGKDDADRVVALRRLRLSQKLDEEHGHNAHERRAEEQPRRREVVHEEEREHDAEEHRVTDRIRHHREIAQEQEHAGQGARRRRQGEHDERIGHASSLLPRFLNAPRLPKNMDKKAMAEAAKMMLGPVDIPCSSVLT